MDSANLRPVRLRYDPVLWLTGGMVVILVLRLSPVLTDYRVSIAAAGLVLATVFAASQPRQRWSWGVVLLAGLLLTSRFAATDGIGILSLLWGCSLLALGVSACRASQEMSPAPPSLVRAPVSNSVAVHEPAELLSLLDAFDPFNDSLEDGEALEASGQMPGELLQQLERRRLLDGSETLSGQLRISLAAGERLKAVHVPLHPSLPGLQQVWLEVIDGGALTVEEDVTRPYGLRFLVRRTGKSTDPVTALIGISATTATHCRAA